MLKLWYIDEMQVSSKMNINLCKPKYASSWVNSLNQGAFSEEYKMRDFYLGNEEIGCLLK